LPQPYISDRAGDGQRLGAGVVGLGVGEQHARAYLDHPACELRWIFDIDPAAAARSRATLGTGSVAASFDEMLADPRLDVVSIASFDDAHFSQVMAALDAGKHVFVEKPLCRSSAELQRIKNKWTERPSLQVRSNLVLRGAPLYRWLRAAMAAGELGEIYAIDGDYLYGRLHKITDGWRASVVDYSVMQGGGVHLVDLMMWLTRQRPVAVTASGNSISTKGSAFRYHDFMAATFQFESGLVGRIAANFGSVHRHQHVVRVFGTRATFIHDDQGARLHTSRDPMVPAQPIGFAPLPLSKGALIPDFVASVLGAGDGSSEMQQECDLISACLAADCASATGTRQRVDYV
jgi:predicted dehydrogenase